MPTNTTAYSVGDDVRLQTVVRSTADVLTDSTVTLFIKAPNGTVTKYGPTASTNSTALDHIATGTWRRLLQVSSAGLHKYQWQSSGVIRVSTGGHFTVHRRYASTST